MYKTAQMFLLVFVFGFLLNLTTKPANATFCEPNLSGDWTVSSSCVIYENTNGAAAGNINLPNGSTITLHTGKTLVWYPNKSINVATGSHIIVNTGAKIDQTLLCLKESGTNSNYGTYATSTDPRTGQTLYLGLDQIPASSTTTTADNTLLGKYAFENCSGTTISDLVSTNHGTLSLGAGGTTSAGTCNPVAGAWGAGATGRTGSSISLDGTDDYVSIPNNRSADTIASVAFWYKANRVGNGGTGSFSADLIQHTNFTNSGYWIEWRNNGSLELSVAGQAGIVSTTIATTVDTSSWHHVAITVSSNGTSTAYFDGKLSNTLATGNWTNYTGNLLIGSGSGGTNNASAFNQNFGGQIDDLRIYSRALNSNEVGNLASMPNTISKYCGVGYKPRETYVNIAYVDIAGTGVTGAMATLYRTLLNMGFYIYNNVTNALVTTREVAAAGNVIRVLGDNMQVCNSGSACSFNPAASYGNVYVENLNQSATLTNFTQPATYSPGLGIVTNYGAGGVYTPGIFWNTTDNNSTKPKTGIWNYLDGSGSRLMLGTSNSYVTGITNTAMTINASGYVGVGTTNPTYNLDVTGTGRFTGAVTGASFTGSVAYSSLTGLPAFAANANAGRVRMYEVGCGASWGSSCDAGADGYVDSANNATYAAYATNAVYAPSTGTSYSARFQVREPLTRGAGGGLDSEAPALGFHWAGRVASSLMMNAAGDFKFVDNPGTGLEDVYMKILYTPFIYDNDNTGYYLDPNSTSNVATMNVNNLLVAGKWRFADTLADSWLRVYGNANGTYYGGIASGALYSSSTVQAASDARLKSNITTIPNALEDLLKLRGVKFNWNEKAYKLTKTINTKDEQIGLIAQEVEKVYPQLVKNGPEGYKSLSYENLTAVLVEAFKEEHQNVVKLQDEVEELKKQVSKLSK